MTTVDDRPTGYQYDLTTATVSFDDFTTSTHVVCTYTTDDCPSPDDTYDEEKAEFERQERMRRERVGWRKVSARHNFYQSKWVMNRP